MKPETCVAPECPAVVQTQMIEVRRGDRSILAPARSWRCACRQDPETGQPLEWADQKMIREDEAEAARIWEQTFGEPIPPAQALHKMPRAVLGVRVNSEDLRWIDAHRGERSREEFVHDLIRDQRKAG